MIDERSGLETGGYIVVDSVQDFEAALRAIDEAGVRLALVTRIVAGGEPEVLGVITEHSIAQLAFVNARLAE